MDAATRVKKRKKRKERKAEKNSWQKTGRKGGQRVPTCRLRSSVLSLTCSSWAKSHDPPASCDFRHFSQSRQPTIARFLYAFAFYCLRNSYTVHSMLPPSRSASEWIKERLAQDDQVLGFTIIGKLWNSVSLSRTAHSFSHVRYIEFLPQTNP